MATGTIRGEKVRLDLEKIEKKDEIEIIAVITGKNGPVRDVRLAFFLNNRPVGEPQDTDPFGRIAVTISNPAPGEHKFMAQALDGDLSATATISVKKPQEKVPDNFDARIIGDKDAGKIKFAISVYSNHRGCKGLVRVLENETGRVFQFPTDENGVGVYPAEGDFHFFEQDRTYIVRVDHVEKEEAFSLEAPPHYEAISFPRIFLCWGVVILWLIINLVVFVDTPKREATVDYQTYAELPEHEQYALKRMYEREGKQFPTLPSSIEKLTETAASNLRWGNWRLWWLSIVLALAYTVTRLWRLISRAWTHVQRRIGEDRSGTSKEFGRKDGVAAAANPQQRTTAPSQPQGDGWGWRRTFHEFVNEVFAEIVVHGFRRK